MKLKTNTVIKTLKGQPFKDGVDEVTVGTALSNIMSFDKGAGKFKGYILAKKLMEGKDIDIDKADLALIKKAVETTEVYASNILLGFLIETLDEIKEK